MAFRSKGEVGGGPFGWSMEAALVHAPWVALVLVYGLMRALGATHPIT